MYCSKCGKELGSEGSFCSHCGAKSNQRAEKKQAEKKKSGNLMKYFGWTLCFSVLVVLLFDSDSTKKTTVKQKPTSNEIDFTKPYVTKANHTACISKDLHNTMVTYVMQGDKVAYGRVIESGDCVLTKAGVEVYIQDYSWGVCEVRLTGQTQTVWIAIEGIKLK